MLSVLAGSSKFVCDSTLKLVKHFTAVIVLSLVPTMNNGKGLQTVPLSAEN